MKRALSILLALILVFVLTTTALADNIIKRTRAQFESTRAFLAYLDQIDQEYDYGGVDDDNDELVVVHMEGDDLTAHVNVFFDDDSTSALIRIWNAIDYDEARYTEVLELVNDLNASYRWACFYADTSDNSVTIAADVVFEPEDAGLLTMGYLQYMFSVVEAAYDSLAELQK